MSWCTAALRSPDHSDRMWLRRRETVPVSDVLARLLHERQHEAAPAHTPRARRRPLPAVAFDATAAAAADVAAAAASGGLCLCACSLSALAQRTIGRGRGHLWPERRRRAPAAVRRTQRLRLRHQPLVFASTFEERVASALSRLRG